MSDSAIIVEHNYLADPGEHQSLLLVRYGTLTIEIKRHLAAWSVVAVRAKGNRYPVTERVIDAATLEEAAARARRLVRELGP